MSSIQNAIFWAGVLQVSAKREPVRRLSKKYHSVLKTPDTIADSHDTCGTGDFPVSSTRSVISNTILVISNTILVYFATSTVGAYVPILHVIFEKCCSTDKFVISCDTECYYSEIA